MHAALAHAIATKTIPHITRGDWVHSSLHKLTGAVLVGTDEAVSYVFAHIGKRVLRYAYDVQTRNFVRLEGEALDRLIVLATY